MEIKKPKFMHDFFNGVIEGEGVENYKKLYKDISFAYKSFDETLDPDCEMYEVYHFNEGGKNTILWGLTIMHPITVNGECNLTRGHFHQDRTEPEIYFGLGGKGLLMYMDENGDSFCEEVYRNSLHYIKGNYAHRLINIGDEDLKVGACWREAAGHDYKAIEEKPFKNRVYKINGELVIKD